VLDGYVSFEAAVRDYGADPVLLQRAVEEWTLQKGAKQWHIA